MGGIELGRNMWWMGGEPRGSCVSEKGGVGSCGQTLVDKLCEYDSVHLLRLGGLMF